MKSGEAQTALHLAASARKKLCAVNTMVAAGGSRILQLFAGYALLEINALDVLIAAGADLNVQSIHGYSPLEVSIHTALDTLDDALFWRLVERGANLDLRNPLTRDSPRMLYTTNSFLWDGAPLP